MKQHFSHFEMWEDFKEGLYKTSCENKDVKLKESVLLLGNKISFYTSAEKMLNDWEEASKVNLTNLGQNRLAWLGQATCCHAHGAPDFVTKEAWWILSEKQREDANDIAGTLIEYWCDKYEGDSEVLCLKLD